MSGYRNPMHGMARRRHTSSRHFQRRRSSGGCAVWILVLGAGVMAGAWQVAEVLV